MTFRITDAAMLAQCSPHVRAQLEKAFAPPSSIAVAVPTEVSPEFVQASEVRKRSARPEQDAGALLVKWIDLVVLPDGLRPGLFFYHVANGGGRSRVEAGILKGQGVRAGWPDYCLDLPAGGYHGLRLELKALDGPKPPDHQLEILERLESVGFKCCVAWGFEEAQAYVVDYLDIYQRSAAARGEAGRAKAHGVPADE